MYEQLQGRKQGREGVTMLQNRKQRPGAKGRNAPRHKGPALRQSFRYKDLVPKYTGMKNTAGNA